MTALTKFVGTPKFHYLDTIFNVLSDESSKYIFGDNETYPPYNVWIEETGECKVEISVSGFTKDELSIEFDGRSLVITGKKTNDSINEPNKRWIKRGLARRSFIRRFDVKGSYLLDTAVLKNGILSISLKSDVKRVSVDIVDE